MKLAMSLEGPVNLDPDMGVRPAADADDAQDFAFTLPMGDESDDEGFADDAYDDEGFADDAYDDEGFADDAEDGAIDLVAEAMNLRRSRRESILKQAENRFLSERAASRESILKQAEASDEVAEDALDEDVTVTAEARGESLVKSILDSKVAEKKVDEEREKYRVQLRRAYDVGLEMQRKGLLAHNKTALDKQVDEIMTFDGNAFEAFKRSIGNAKAIGSVKIASDLGGVNIGVESEQAPREHSGRLLTADTLTSMWE